MNGHTPWLWLSHALWVHLSCFFKLCPLCLRIHSQTQIESPQVRLPTVGRTARGHEFHVACPRNVWVWYCRCRLRREHRDMVTWQGGLRQCPSYAFFIPPGPDLQGSTSSLLWWNSQLWRGLGRGGEENVVLIQLWNTTCSFKRTE